MTFDRDAMAKKQSPISPLGENSRSVARQRRLDPEYAALERKYEQSMAIADLVILYRARARLTQRELAERMGTSVTAIARMESGFHLPSTTTLSRLADALGGRLKIEIVFDEPASEPKRRRTATA
ncbi:MAG TPA: helix-turn-helix domain-containing protein [Candidatus Cybelea sp.]|jgi:ribosome-binding protein aMBF1 (putative translation factor)|nr:helix-turn-helix domain-containing protein [Candidatus Cybelea sp.]